MQKMEKTRQVVKYLIEKSPVQLGRTQIAKFVYLVDYLWRAYEGEPITEMNYIWDNHGPFDSSLLKIIKKMKANDEVKEERWQHSSGFGYLYSNGKEDIDYDLTKSQLDLIKEVATTYSKVPLQALLEETVYQTEPMKKAIEKKARYKPLDMDIVNNKLRPDTTTLIEKTPVLMKQIKAALKEVKKGKFLTREQVLKNVK